LSLRSNYGLKLPNAFGVFHQIFKLTQFLFTNRLALDSLTQGVARGFKILSTGSKGLRFVTGFGRFTPSSGVSLQIPS